MGQGLLRRLVSDRLGLNCRPLRFRRAPPLLEHAIYGIYPARANRRQVARDPLVLYRTDPREILVVDVFSKKTQQTPRHVIDTCVRRLREWDAE